MEKVEGKGGAQKIKNTDHLSYPLKVVQSFLTPHLGWHIPDSYKNDNKIKNEEFDFNLIHLN